MKPVFIGGCGRSGTTLLAAMLGTHKQCLTTPEAKFVYLAYRSAMQEYGRADLSTTLDKIKSHWSFKVFDIDVDQADSVLPPDTAYSELIKWIVGQYGRRTGKETADFWVDHVPDNVLYAATLFQLFPDAKFLHLVRDGRAVAASVMKLNWGPNTIPGVTDWWENNIANGLAVESYYGPEYVKRVRYEDLISEPQKTLKEICNFLQIEYQPEMISGMGFEVPQFSRQQHALVGHKPNTDRIHAWQQELSPRQIEIFENIAGNILTCLGYDLLYGLTTPKMTRSEQISTAAREFYGRQIKRRLYRRRRAQEAISVTRYRQN